jgi:mono/diheme cytochrome c family protein
MKNIASLFLLAICLFLVAWQPKNGFIHNEKPPKGKKVYDKICINCHMADAKGIATFVPPLSNSKLVLGQNAKLIRIVLKGSEELKNDRSRKYKNEMPPQAELTDKKVANVLTYIRSNFGNKAPAITAAEVKSVRDKL